MITKTTSVVIYPLAKTRHRPIGTKLGPIKGKAKMKTIFLFSIIILCSFLLFCEKQHTFSDEIKLQFIIKATVPDSLNKNCWFNVVETTKNNTFCVFAVKEIEGSYYLPSMSRGIKKVLGFNLGIYANRNSFFNRTHYEHTT